MALERETWGSTGTAPQGSPVLGCLTAAAVGVESKLFRAKAGLEVRVTEHWFTSS